MLASILDGSTSSIEVTTILWCSLTSIILGFIIALVHKKTSRYTKNFLITLTILPLLVEIVMFMVNGNLGTSVAIVGAFSLVRFRSMPGTSKEIVSVFFAMAIGLATGMGHIAFAIIATIIGCLVLIIFHYLPIFDKKAEEKELKILIPEDLDYTEVFDEIFDKFLSKVTLISTKTTNMGSMFEVKYFVNMKKDVNEKEFIDEIRSRNGNLKVSLSQPLESNELL